jgi:S1-C subfamily serine protease
MYRLTRQIGWTVWLLSLVGMFAGCSTAVRKFEVDAMGAKGYSIQPSQFATAEFSGSIAEILESKGYVRSDDTRKSISIRIEGSDANLYNTWRSIVAEYGGRPMLVVTAKNGGFGTLVAPGAALEDLQNRCLNDFRKAMPQRSGASVQDIAESDQPSGSMSVHSFGSGFLVSTSGHFVTAFHVIEDAAKIDVTFSDGVVRNATVVRTLPSVDLALLRIEPGPTVALPLAEPEALRLGERVFTVGFPTPDLLGAAPKFADGAVSGLQGRNGDASMLQMTVPIQPGNSGGPVIGESGEVIGVVVAKVNDAMFLDQTGTLPQNLNFAVRADLVRVLIADSEKSGAPNQPLDREDAVARAIAAVGLVRTYQPKPR